MHSHEQEDPPFASQEVIVQTQGFSPPADRGPISDTQKDASHVQVMPQEDTTLVSHEASSNEQLGDPAPDGHDHSAVASDPSEG